MIFRFFVLFLLMLYPANLQAMDVMTAKSCRERMNLAQMCEQDSDCEIVFGVSCLPCECYVAYNRSAKLDPVKKLSTDLIKNIDCEPCGPEKPVAICVNRECMADYTQVGLSAHSQLPDTYQSYKVRIADVIEVPTRRLRYSFEFNLIGDEVGESDDFIAFNLYQDRGIQKLLNHLNVRFQDSEQFARSKSAKQADLIKNSELILHVWDVSDSTQNVALENKVAGFFWINTSKPYPRIYHSGWYR